MEFSEKHLMEHQRQFRRIADKAETAFKRGNFHSAIAWTQIAARFAWERHPGFYCDLTLESLLTEIANKVDERSVTSLITSQILPHDKSSKKPHVLHVITGCEGLGGHTLVVAGWIRNTIDTAVHSIVATSQKRPLPPALTMLAKTSGGSCQQLAKFSSNLLDRSLLLRHYRSWADLVVIHANPSDALPSVAFGVEGGPPVFLYNHADDVFWLGVSIADVVLDLHPAGQSQTLNRRGAKASKILPIPLNKPPEDLSYKDARERLGIKPETTVLLTVGRECKYLPIGEHDFLGIIYKILKKHSNAVLLSIGPENRGRWAKVSAMSGGRIIPMGGIEWSKLSPFYASADIFLDSFPIGTGTAFLEAGTRGIPTIGLQFKEAPSITEGTDEISFGNLNEFPSSVGEYTSLLEQMIAEPFPFKERARKFKALITEHHFSPGWNRYLDDAVRQSPSRHTINLPKNLPSNIEPANKIVADWDAEVLSNETAQQTYARIMFMYSTKLQKSEMLQEQTTNFLSVFLKTPNQAGARALLYYFKRDVLASPIDYPEVV